MAATPLLIETMAVLRLGTDAFLEPLLILDARDSGVRRGKLSCLSGVGGSLLRSSSSWLFRLRLSI